MSAVHPWDVDPALKSQRLVTLARLAAETRQRVFAEADRDAGDTNWGLGCRAYERFSHAAARLAEDRDHAWLTVHREGLAFIPSIDGVAIRVYRGAADKPHARHLNAARLEHDRANAKQMSLPFLGAEPNEWFWMLALETDDVGQVTRAVYFQCNAAGDRRHVWTALEAERAVVAALKLATEGDGAAQDVGELRLSPARARAAVNPSRSRRGSRRRDPILAL